MVRPQREKLKGAIEVDETYVGGEKPGKRGRGADGKDIVLIAAEKDGKGIGRIRLKHIQDVTGKTLKGEILSLINTPSTIITDGWSGYSKLNEKGYEHVVLLSYKGKGIGDDMLPRCHRVASLFKRWVMGTLQGSFCSEHLQDYLDEFTFRFNRRKSASRGKLFYRLAQQAMQVEAVSYSEITRHNI